MEVNTDMKKALRGGILVVYLNATPTQKETKELSFHKFYRDKRNGSFLSRERILFLVSAVCAHSIFMGPKSKADQTSLLYFHCFLSPNRETSKNT